MEQLYEDDNEVAVLSRSSSRFTRRLRRSILCAFNSQYKQSKCFRLNIIFSLSLALLAATQGVSLVMHSQADGLGDSAAVQSVLIFISYVRADTLAFRLELLYEFFYVLIALIYCPLAVLVTNTVMIMAWKRKPHWLVVKVMSLSLSLLEEILLLPALVLMCSFLKFTYIAPTASMHEYSGSRDKLNSPLHALISLFTAPLLFGLLYLHSYFLYENVYSKRRRLIYSMADSFVHRVHLVTRTGLVLCFSFLSILVGIWYRLGIAALSIFMLVLYYRRLTYFNPVLNVANASKKAVVAWAVACYFVGYFSESATAAVFLLLFVSPLIVIKVMLSMADRAKKANKQRLNRMTAPYEVELKLRGYYDALQSSSEDGCALLHHKVQQIFEFATRTFPRCPLVPVWESLYYWHYRKDLFQALLKISKVNLCDQTLESQFFTQKFLDKYISLDRSPERLFLRYLTLLDEAKRSDEHCCLILLSLCTDLLNLKTDAQKLASNAWKLAKFVQKTTRKYQKTLAVHIENEEALKMLGSFLTDIAKDQEGKKYARQATTIRTRKEEVGVLNEMISERQAFIVISCGAVSPGTVVLANAQACNLLNTTKAEIIQKSIVNFLPLCLRSLLLPALLIVKSPQVGAEKSASALNAPKCDCIYNERNRQER